MQLDHMNQHPIEGEKMTDVMPLTGQLYRHKKTGHVYRVLLAHCRIEATNTEAVAYQSSEQKFATVWIRPYDEFCDGRFEPLRSVVDLLYDKIMSDERTSD